MVKKKLPSPVKRAMLAGQRRLINRSRKAACSTRIKKVSTGSEHELKDGKGWTLLCMHSLSSCHCRPSLGSTWPVSTLHCTLHTHLQVAATCSGTENGLDSSGLAEHKTNALAHG